MPLVYGHDKVVWEWASKQFGRPLAPCLAAIGVIDGNGKLIGAGIYQDFNGSNVEFSYYGPKSVNLGNVRAFMRYAFIALGANRMTVRTPARNKMVRQKIHKLGFHAEGSMPFYYGPWAKDTALIFGLRRKDAERFIGPIPDHRRAAA